MAGESKTEKASDKKRRDERKKGNVFMSTDAVAVVTLFASFMSIKILAASIAENLAGFMRLCLSYCGKNIDGAGAAFAQDLEGQAILLVAKTAGPLMLITALFAIAATFAQTKLLVSGESLKPKFSRISPLQGFKRLFSLKSVVNALKGILKITILLVIIYSSLKAMFGEISKFLYVDISVAGSSLFQKAMSMVFKIALAFTVLAGFDILYQWWDYERELKMSKQEVKEEYKQTEGDPQIKSKIKSLQRSMSQSRMMQQVPQSDVVIRNPTHFAVALRYKPESDAAPVVMAMGQDEIALRIVKTAEENNIPTIENPPLARALYAEAEMNREIPPQFYTAVAEVLVYIFRINDENKIVRAGVND